MTDFDTWQEYRSSTLPRLGGRANSFERIFAHLDTIDAPVIVETGVYRRIDNYAGDGCSTLLFDNYVTHNGGTLYSVDISPDACRLARQSTRNALICCADSVAFLDDFDSPIDLLYLDSFDVRDWNFDWPSASHHLKELFAARPSLKPGTLVVVDDNLLSLSGGKPAVKGKGRLIKEIFDSMGIAPSIADYQLGWLWQG